MSSLIFNSANLIGITTGSLNATEEDKELHAGLELDCTGSLSVWIDEWYVWAMLYLREVKIRSNNNNLTL